MYYVLQEETDTRFAEDQQQLTERDAKVRDLRVRIHCSHIVGNLVGVVVGERGLIWQLTIRMIVGSSELCFIFGSVLFSFSCYLMQ